MNIIPIGNPNNTRLGGKIVVRPRPQTPAKPSN
jgi:hypothetical protein